MKEYLFVYGSLRSSGEVPERIAHLVRRFHRVGQATVQGRLYDFGKHCGGILEADTAMNVHGELVELPDEEMLRELDRYEEIDLVDPSNSLFARKRTKALLADGSSQDAWIYVYNKPPGDAPLIESGDYHQFKKLKH